jgi:hypothetical protein
LLSNRCAGGKRKRHGQGNDSRPTHERSVSGRR